MTTSPVTIGEHMGLPEFAEDLPGQLKVLVGTDVTLDGVVSFTAHFKIHV